MDLPGHLGGDTLAVEERFDCLVPPAFDAVPSSPCPSPEPEPDISRTRASQHATASGVTNSTCQPTPTSSTPGSGSSSSTTIAAAPRLVRKTCKRHFRIPCAHRGEPGCPMLFGSKRERNRHRRESCEMLAQRSFHCCCGGSVKRWANFRKSHSSCSPAKGCIFQCHCEAIYDSFRQLEDHYVAAHMGKKGRPRGPC